jgi:hypothetical protein
MAAAAGSRETFGSRNARGGLCACSAFLGAAFAWAAVVLPSRPGTPLACLAAALAVLHGLTSVAVLTGSALLRKVLRATAFGSLASAVLFMGALGWTSGAVVGLYGALGWGLTALLAPIGVLLLGATLPFGIWGLRVSRADPDRDGP